MLSEIIKNLTRKAKKISKVFLVVSGDFSRKRIKRQKFPCLKKRNLVSFQVLAFLVVLNSSEIFTRYTWI